MLKKNLKKIMPDGKTLIVPMDHGVSMGPIEGLVNMEETIKKAKEADAVIVHRGIAKNVDIRTGFFVHLTGSTGLSPKPNYKKLVSSVDRAIKLGADGVSVHINIGCEHDVDMLHDMGMVADRCDDTDTPLLAMMYARGEKIDKEKKFDPETIAFISRVGAELGADIIKTVYTGSVESFKKVTKSCPVPVVIAGGPKCETNRELLEMTTESLKAGGAGVTFGRNVFQHQDPEKIISALKKIIHGNKSVDEALKVLGE